MRHPASWFLVALLLTTVASRPAAGVEPAEPSPGATPLPWLVEHVELGALWYLHFTVDNDGEATEARFSVSRGYSTIKLIPTEWFRARSTVDLHEDDDGWELRLKYLYGRFTIPIETPVITEPRVEFGLVHTPWLDYEEHVNRYRLQGTMFMERNHLFNSADLGITGFFLIGPRLPREYRNDVSPAYPGRYGSFAAGLYNGGGYHGPELNDNKVFMLRATVRPLGPLLPHLSLSYFLIHGRGNSEDAPLWQLHAGFLSFEHRYFVVTGQVATGRGDQNGERIDADGDALRHLGASAFLEVRLPWIHSALFGRYDWYRWWDGVPDDDGRVIVGVAFYFWRRCAIAVDLDLLHDLERAQDPTWSVKTTLQLKLP